MAIKPICEALGVDYSAQLQKLKEDEFLSSVVGLSPTTGADGKQYEMTCLPLKFVFGWLFTINPKNVKEEAREAVAKYRLECYEVLYNHFFASARKQLEVNQLEISLLEEINALNETKTQVVSEIKDKKTILERIREERLRNEPTLF